MTLAEMLSASGPSRPSMYREMPRQASEIAKPTPLRKKKSTYSRRSPDLARCRKVQCRLPAYETVTAAMNDKVLAVSGLS
jgi:hypothetical protein